MKNPAKCRVFVDVVQNTYRQRLQWQSHSCSERTIVTIAVVGFISVLYMRIGKKSRLSGLITSRILAGWNTLAITVGAVSESAQIHRHESYHFVFAGFVPGVTFDGMLHDVSFSYIYNACADQMVDNTGKFDKNLFVDHKIIVFQWKTNDAQASDNLVKQSFVVEPNSNSPTCSGDDPYTM